MSHRFTIDYPEDYDFICTGSLRNFILQKKISAATIFSSCWKINLLYEINSFRYAGVNWYRQSFVRPENHHRPAKPGQLTEYLRNLVNPDAMETQSPAFKKI